MIILVLELIVTFRNVGLKNMYALNTTGSFQQMAGRGSLFF